MLLSGHGDLAGVERASCEGCGRPLAAILLGRTARRLCALCGDTAQASARPCPPTHRLRLSRASRRPSCGGEHAGDGGDMGANLCAARLQEPPAGLARDILLSPRIFHGEPYG